MDGTGDPCAAGRQAAGLAAARGRVLLVRDAVRRRCLARRCLSARREQRSEPLPADATREEWRQALRAVAAGTAAERAAGMPAPHGGGPPAGGAEPREREVVRLTARALSTALPSRCA